MPRIVRHDDPHLTWEGAISLQRPPDGTQACRLPFERLALIPFDVLQTKAANAAGVRIVFQTDTRSIAIAFDGSGDGLSPLDVVCDGALVATLPADGRERLQVDDLPAGTKRLELWLPHFGQFRLKTIEIDDGASLARSVLPRKRWITYGSSISQCSAANSPTRTWPAIVARTMDLDLTCLGFGGQCHLDPMLGKVIRDQPADYISLCLGINTHGGSLTPRTFQPAIIGLVTTIREKHPTTPLVVMSPILSPPRETEPNAAGWTLPVMREHVQEAVSRIKQYGDDNLHYVNGLDIFGPDLVHLLPDALHPNDEGYGRMGANFVEKVARRWFI